MPERARRRRTDSRAKPAARIKELEQRLLEAEETIEAIRGGEVDAFVIQTPAGESIYTLEGADRPYRILVEHMHQGALMLAADGTILYCNECFATLAGSKADALTGRSFSTCLSRADDAALPALLKAGAVGPSHADLELLRTDGSSIPVHLTINPLPLEGTAVCSVIVTDLTQQRQYDELRRTQRQLRDAERRKDIFLDSLAEQLVKTLAPLRNGLQILETAGDTLTLERARDMMRQQLRQMVRLVDELLDVSRVALGTLELRAQRTDVGAVLRSAVAAVEPQAVNLGHRLDVRIASETLFAHADERRLAQVFTILLSNAIKFTPRGGRIEVSLERAGSEVVIKVRDNGIGITPSLMSRLFDMFAPQEPGARTAGSLGIGLSIARQLVQLHDGTIGARSDGPDKGSEFVVRLPLLADSPLPETITGETRVRRRPKDAPPAARRRVLLVDDDAAGAQSLAMLLSVSGHEVRIAPDANQAWDLAEWYRPHVILINPATRGLEAGSLVRRIRTESWANATAFVAVGAGAGKLTMGGPFGFDHLLIEPVDPADLLAVLASPTPTRG